MALVSGVFAVRLTWHYFAIITVVFSLIFYFLAVRMKPLTGGDDGINFSMPPTFVFGKTSYSFTDSTFKSKILEIFNSWANKNSFKCDS